MTKEILQIESPALGCLLGTAYQTLLSQLNTALKAAGLDITTSEYLIMRALYCKDGIQQCEIGDMVGKDKGAVCRCVAGMEKKGYVRTEAISHKCLRVYVTEKGYSVQKEIFDVAASRHKALTDMTTPEEIEVFTNVLNKIITKTNIKERKQQ